MPGMSMAPERWTLKSSSLVEHVREVMARGDAIV